MCRSSGTNTWFPGKNVSLNLTNIILLYDEDINQCSDMYKCFRNSYIHSFFTNQLSKTIL